MIVISKKEFEELSKFIHKNYGIRLKPEKQNLLMGRLQNVLLSMGFKNFTDYYQYVVADETGEAALTLVNRVTTNHTFFMREANHFYYFKDVVLANLSNRIKDNDLRIWCAACSTGEEAYTLAMIIDEFCKKEKLNWDKKLLATDISDRVLIEARSGIYNQERILPLPPQWRLNYFQKHDGDRFIITEGLKKEVIYRRFNLMDKVFPFKRKFHAVFCRNVMIYFDVQTKVELINKIYDSLEDGGYLFIGHSESLTNIKSGFKYVQPSIYQKG